VNDVSKNIRSYAFTILDGNITFEAANVPCFTKVPPRQSFPYVVIKTGTGTPNHMKDSPYMIYELIVEVNTRMEKNVGGQDDCDDITDSIIALLGPLSQNTTAFTDDAAFMITGPNFFPYEDDDDNFHYYSKRISYEVHVQQTTALQEFYGGVGYFIVN
jgi:hypothetical protein